MFETFGAYVLLIAAAASTIWWLLTFKGVIGKEAVEISEPSTTNADKKALRSSVPFKWPFNKSLESWIFSMLMKNIFRRIKVNLKRIRSNGYKVLFVFVVEPLVVLAGLTNDVGERWVGFVMLVFVLLSWVALGWILWKQYGGDEPQPESERTKWEKLMELALYFVPVVYTWYQFLKVLVPG